MMMSDDNEVNRMNTTLNGYANGSDYHAFIPMMIVMGDNGEANGEWWVVALIVSDDW